MTSNRSNVNIFDQNCLVLLTLYPIYCQKDLFLYKMFHQLERFHFTFKFSALTGGWF